MKEVEETAALLCAGGDCCPHPLVITLAHRTVGTLRDAAVDHAVANLLFAVSVRTLNTGHE